MKRGFTVLELLVVISIIGLLSGVILSSLDITRKKARDARRLSDMNQIVLALDLYYNDNGRYPSPVSDTICSGWDAGNLTLELLPGRLDEYINTPNDPTGTGCSGYNYYRYGAGSYGCDVSRGAFYVLGVRNMMEATSGSYPTSPGWSCPTRNWGTSEFEWVTGKFEN